MTNPEKNSFTDCIMIVIIDGEEHIVESSESQTILDATLEASIDIPFSCEAGFCTACKAMLVEGNVVMENNETLDEEDLTQGYILTCVSKPTTEEITVNFDL